MNRNYSGGGTELSDVFRRYHNVSRGNQRFFFSTFHLAHLDSLRTGESCEPHPLPSYETASVDKSQVMIFVSDTSPFLRVTLIKGGIRHLKIIPQLLTEHFTRRPQGDLIPREHGSSFSR
jgi:hypothetical protein